MDMIILFPLTVTAVGVVDSLAAKPVADGCKYEGHWYPEGQFQPRRCQHCDCHGGLVDCIPLDCFFAPCVDAIYDADHCCRYCPNGRT